MSANSAGAKAKPSHRFFMSFILITFWVVEWNFSSHQDAGDQDFSDTAVPRKI